MPNLAFKSETNLQTELMRLENLAAEAREQLKTAKVRALRAENKYTEAAKLVKDSERKILQQQYRIDSLAETLATNSTALLEVVFKAKETEENAEKKEKALREHITELVEQHRETVAQLNARNVILQDEVNSGKEARLQLTSEENQRVKDAEEAARRAKGEANHLVRSQTGQLNKLKAMCNAYRERYGNLDDAKASDAKTPSLNALSSAPSVKQSGEDQPSTNGAIEGTSQSFAQVDSVSSQSAATWRPNSQDPDSALTSSTADGRSYACHNPGSSLDTCSSGIQRNPGYKTRHRRGTRPRSSKNSSQLGEELPADTPTGPKA